MAQLSWPFDPSTISEGYGNSSWRVSANNPTGLHDGIDFAIGAGNELRAAVSGVVYNNDAGSDGAGVDITSDDGWKVRMWHVSKFLVPNGSYVNAGDVVALSGGIPGTWGAGFTTGPHMHFGVKINGAWVDPAGLINGTAPSTPSAEGSVSDLAAAVLRGDFGNGPARQAALGARYDEVQAEVNRILNGGAAAPSTPSVSTANNVVQPGDGYWHIAQRNWGGDNAQIEANMHKLIELNGNKRLFAGDTVILEAPAPAPAPAPVATPELVPVVEETKPEVKPEASEHKPIPKGETMETPEQDKTAALEYQKAMVAPIKPADLGTIITNNKTRKIVWAAYGLVGLAIVAVMGGLTQAQMIAPQWFLVATGSYTALGPAFSSLAIANISTKKKPK